MGRTRYELQQTTITAAHPAALAAPQRLANHSPSARLASPWFLSTIDAAHARRIAPPLRQIDLHTATTPVARPSLSMTPAPFACVPERADPPRRPRAAATHGRGQQTVLARRLAPLAPLARPTLLASSPLAGFPRAAQSLVASGPFAPPAASRSSSPFTA